MNYRPVFQKVVYATRRKPLTFLSGWLALGVGLSLLPVTANAQHAGHGGYGQSAHSTEILDQTETLPSDNAVLPRAPEQLQLQFPHQVRLVKLTLRNEKHDWVDISFRYNPLPDSRFTWQLPGLQQATYYTADWAILGDNDELIRGSFSFAFGPDAEPPSVTREAERMLLEQRNGTDPNIRYVAPPPTQIILDQDQPNYDPPFTIQLDDRRRQ